MRKLSAAIGLKKYASHFTIGSLEKPEKQVFIAGAKYVFEGARNLKTMHRRSAKPGISLTVLLVTACGGAGNSASTGVDASQPRNDDAVTNETLPVVVDATGDSGVVPEDAFVERADVFTD